MYLDLVRKDHPKSRHVCFGFVSGGGSEGGVGTERCSDDGEPTGTAVSCYYSCKLDLRLIPHIAVYSDLICLMVVYT